MRPFAYARPGSAAEAVAAIAAAGPGARFLAGGTTLYDLMKLDVMQPTTVVDVRGLPGLTGIATDRPEGLRFGALATMTDVAADPVVAQDYPALAESLLLAASRNLRNMASVGGNLLQRTRCSYFRGDADYACNKRQPGSGCSAIQGIDRGLAVLGTSDACVANYPGDWATALAAFDAEIETESPRGARTIAIHDLHVAPGDTPEVETTLEPDELIVAIVVPPLAFGRASTYHKIRDRESYAFALASAAVALDLEGGAVREARIALGGVATRPWRARDAERLLVGQPLTAATARRAGEAAFAGARPGRYNGLKVELGIRTVADALRIAQERGSR